MKIGFVISCFSPLAGGTATAAYNLARQLAGFGHEVVIFTSDAYRGAIQFPEEQTLRVLESKCRLRFSGFYYSPGFARSLQETASAFDILHLHNFRTYQNIAARRFALEHRRPYVLQAHGSVPRSAKRYSKWVFDKAYGSRILLDASLLVALTEEEARQYASMHTDAAKSVVIPNGINLEEYSTLPARGQFRNSFGIGEGAKLILYLGRVHKRKGIDFLIRAFAQLAKKTPGGGVVLVVAGPDVGYASDAKRLASSLNLGKSVIFTGMLPEDQKRCALTDADLVVYPSRSEPFGIVALEAAASSKPVIVSKSTPMAATVEAGRFGMAVSYGDVDELAKMMGAAIGDEELANTMGSNGRKLVFADFDWVKVARRFERAYESVIEAQHHPAGPTEGRG